MTCNNPDCTIDEPDGTCFKGHSKEDCDQYKNDEIEVEKAPTVSNEEESSFKPLFDGWGMLPSCVHKLSGIKRPTIIALVGLTDAGKTSFLISLFLRIRSELLGNYIFSGSETLKQWNLLSKETRWIHQSQPQYPARTTSNSRFPSFLHLALRTGIPQNNDLADDLLDILVADNPGEWYRDWVENKNGTQGAASAEWTVAHADSIILCIDTVALHSRQKNLAKHDIQTLIARIKSIYSPKQKLVIALTKSDMLTEPPSPAYLAVLSMIEDSFPESEIVGCISLWQDEKALGVIKVISESINELPKSTPEFHETNIDNAKEVWSFITSWVPEVIKTNE